ncbi:hypothetical protein OG453_14395 [Streptomyces sp. NBC_01381]|uniref:hypothetical protein n=1 Tax=unclassified Streptomyces TaxID=2593676 RepID=UPI002251E6A2|nr:hypothetical protein [Streptomyces sp. NBC_01381]MCX4667846.1 hypothetical protein [Streptomyces sp. NBC_01381]
MAKKQHRKTGVSDRGRASAAEQAGEQAKTSAEQAESRMKDAVQSQGSPAEVARKHQRRFGHN